MLFLVPRVPGIPPELLWFVAARAALGGTGAEGLHGYRKELAAFFRIWDNLGDEGG